MVELVYNTVEFALLVSAELGTVQSNIGTLIKEGLGPRADVDHLLARDTCLALAKLSTKVACQNCCQLLVMLHHDIRKVLHTF